jgi:hypothetical protein
MREPDERDARLLPARQQRRLRVAAVSRDIRADRIRNAGVVAGDEAADGVQHALLCAPHHDGRESFQVEARCRLAQQCQRIVRHSIISFEVGYAGFP